MSEKMFSREALDWVQALRDAGIQVITPAADRTGATPTQMKDTLATVVDRLMQASPTVRSAVIEALGEQGFRGEQDDKLVAEVLRRITKREPDWQLRSKIIETLVSLELEEGIEVPMEVAQTDLDPEVRAEAIRQLGNCALAAWPQLAERSRSVPHVRGAIRTRGVTSAASRNLSPDAESILELLDRLRFRDPSLDVRRAADDTLARLDE